MIDVTKPITITVNDLSPDERIELIGAIWDSMSAEMITHEPTGELKAELDRRLDAYEKDPDRGLPRGGSETENHRAMSDYRLVI